MEQELKYYFKEFSKLTDQVIELKQNDLELENVLFLQCLLLEEIRRKFDAQKEIE